MIPRSMFLVEYIKKKFFRCFFSLFLLLCSFYIVFPNKIIAVCVWVAFGPMRMLHIFNIFILFDLNLIFLLFALFLAFRSHTTRLARNAQRKRDFLLFVCVEMYDSYTWNAINSQNGKIFTVKKKCFFFKFPLPFYHIFIFNSRVLHMKNINMNTNTHPNSMNLEAKYKKLKKKSVFFTFHIVGLMSAPYYHCTVYGKTCRLVF